MDDPRTSSPRPGGSLPVDRKSDEARHPTIPILIKVWAGEAGHDLRTIRRSLASLLASGLPTAARVVLVDDCSTDPRVEPLLAGIVRHDARFELWRNPDRLGPDAGHVASFARLVERFPDVREYVLCDDDVVYHPGWLQRLLAVRREAVERGVDGIFSAFNTPFRPVRSSLRLPTSEVLLKERQPALNWLLPRAIYERIGEFRDVGIAFDSDYCNRASELGIPVLCLRPSWVQNIGYQGAYQSSDRVKANDFVGRRDLWLWSRDLAWATRRRAREAFERLRRRVTSRGA